jgi:hypothetical protein
VSKGEATLVTILDQLDPGRDARNERAAGARAPQAVTVGDAGAHPDLVAAALVEAAEWRHSLVRHRERAVRARHRPARGGVWP